MPATVAAPLSPAALELDLDVFHGPFDLLLALVLREEIDLLEVDLAGIVVAFVDRLAERGELDLEAVTEFLVLIASLLELKTRLMLPGAEGDEQELEPGEAAEELAARMLEYRRYRSAAEWLGVRLAAEAGHRYRSAPLPPALRQVSLEGATQAYEPERLAAAIGGLLRMPPAIDLSHVARPTVSLEQRLDHLRGLLRRGSRFSFDDAVRGGGPAVEAMTLFALLELYKRGELCWTQSEPFGPIEVQATDAAPRIQAEAVSA